MHSSRIHPHLPRPCRRHARAFLTVDAVMSTIIALALVMILSTLLVREQKQEQQLARIRAQARAAEAALLALQSGQPLPPIARVQNLPQHAPDGYRWVLLSIVDTPANGQSAVRIPPITGLVPAAKGNHE